MKIRKRTVIGLVIIFLIVGFIVIAVIKNRQLVGLLVLPTQSYVPTIIPSDTTELFEYDGYIKNDQVFIYVQGGPNWELFDRELSPFTWMSNRGSLLKVFPYQSQILNHSILCASPTLTTDEAQHEVKVSAEMLYRTIKYFKDRDRKVYVLCISHGSQIGLEMLRNFPNIADGIALTMIRLDIDMKAIELMNDGLVPYFDSNNEVTGRHLIPGILRFSRLNNRVENMSMMMKVSRNRYTELLKDKDLSNVVYVYGKYDNKVGKPQHDELDFLENKEAQILELDCGHDDLGGSNKISQINQLLVN